MLATNYNFTCVVLCLLMKFKQLDHEQTSLILLRIYQSTINNIFISLRCWKSHYWACKDKKNICSKGFTFTKNLSLHLSLQSKQYSSSIVCPHGKVISFFNIKIDICNNKFYHYYFLGTCVTILIIITHDSMSVIFF